jgi:tRNA(Ile2) C34 agmatinyltransferase TiaS
MAKNTPPPSCPKCRKAMRFMLVKSGGRKFRCVDCDVPDPLRVPEVKKLLLGALTPRTKGGVTEPAGLE